MRVPVLLADAYGRPDALCLDRRLAGEIRAVVEAPIHLARDLGGLGAEGRAPAFEEDHGDDLAVLGIGEGGEPAIEKQQSDLRSNTGRCTWRSRPV